MRWIDGKRGVAACGCPTRAIGEDVRTYHLRACASVGGPARWPLTRWPRLNSKAETRAMFKEFRDEAWDRWQEAKRMEAAAWREYQAVRLSQGLKRRGKPKERP